jgi:hypothetical protein
MPTSYDYAELEYKRDWPEVARRLEAWWECQILDRAVVQVTAPKDGVPPRPIPEPATLAERWTDVGYVIESALERFRTTYYGGDAIPYYYPNIGPDALTAYLGCDLEFGEDTSWTFPIVEDWSELPPLRFDLENRWWRLTIDLVRAAMEAAPGRFLVGNHDLHGGLDGVASLRDRQTLCLDLIEHPDEVERVLDRLLPVWMQAFDGIYEQVKPVYPGSTGWMGTWSLGKSTPIQDDFICMISPAMFEQFARKHLEVECAWLDRSVYHLDGPGALKHLDAVLTIPRLNAVQWVPGANTGPMIQWLPVLRKVQAAGKALHLSVEPDEVKGLMEALKPEGLCLQTRCGTEQDARDLVDLVGKLTVGK